MADPNVRVCIYCNKEKAWTWNGKKTRDGSKVYIDENNGRWAGRRCPDCERTRVQIAVRCDDFERDIIIKEFEGKGFSVKSRNLPLKVEKDGKTLTVGIKRAFLEGERIVIEGPVEKRTDMVALVFESVRVCTPDQLTKLGTNIGFYNKD